MRQVPFSILLVFPSKAPRPRAGGRIKIIPRTVDFVTPFMSPGIIFDKFFFRWCKAFLLFLGPAYRRLTDCSLHIQKKKPVVWYNELFIL
jgi:hypothetical protein